MKPNILLFWLVLPTKVWLVRGLQSVNKKKYLKRFNYFNWNTQSTTIMITPYISSNQNMFYLCFFSSVVIWFLVSLETQRDNKWANYSSSFELWQNFLKTLKLFYFHIYFFQMLDIFAAVSFLIKNEFIIKTIYALLSICYVLTTIIIIIITKLCETRNWSKASIK